MKILEHITSGRWLLAVPYFAFNYGEKLKRLHFDDAAGKFNHFI